MSFDTVHNLEDLRQTYPNPPRELVCGEDFLHHSYAFGEVAVCVEAVKECLAAARAKADTGAVAHLSKHIKDYGVYRQQMEALATSEKSRGAKNVLPVSVGVR